MGEDLKGVIQNGCMAPHTLVVFRSTLHISVGSVLESPTGVTQDTWVDGINVIGGFIYFYYSKVRSNQALTDGQVLLPYRLSRAELPMVHLIPLLQI